MINDHIGELISNVFKALGHPARIKILLLLQDRPLCVSNIIEALGMEQSNTSQHLNVLKNEGLVESRKEGLNVIYRVKSPIVFELIQCTGKFLLQSLEDTKKQLETGSKSLDAPKNKKISESYTGKYTATTRTIT